MYESEKARLKPFLNFNNEERYDLIRQSIRQVNRAHTGIFNGENQETSIEILRSISIWAMKCDGSLNTDESRFLNNFLKTHETRISNWDEYTAFEAKQLLTAIISAAKHNVRLDNSKQSYYSSFIPAIAVIFGVFATVDKSISDEAGRALNELAKMC